METKKRALAAVLAAALALSGCGGAAPSSAAVPAAASAAAPVTLSWYVNYSWFQAGWGENAVSQAITDRTGTAVHFVVPAGSESEKLDALIAAAFHLSRGDSAQMIEAGLVRLDHQECLNTSKIAQEGAIISVQGKGRIKLISVMSETKKGRLRLTLGFY